VHEELLTLGQLGLEIPSGFNGLNAKLDKDVMNKCCVGLLIGLVCHQPT